MRLVAVFGFMVISPAVAQACPSPLGWSKPLKHLAASAPEVRSALATGSSALLELRSARDVTLAVTRDRKPKLDTSAGLTALDVPKAGKLDVILSSATYVDLVRDGRMLKSTGHTDLQSCTGLRKLVTFDVVPGRYIVQLTDAPGRAVKIATVLR